MSRPTSSVPSEDLDTLVCKTLCDFTAEEEGDLTFQEGESLVIIGIREDGWWEAKNSSGETGFVPSNFLKTPDQMKSFSKTLIESEKEKERLPIKESSSANLSSELDLPIGFHRSKLLEVLRKDSSYLMGNFMAPKLDSLGLSLEDVHYEITDNSLKSNSTFIEKIIGLVAVRQVPPPPAGYVTRSCQVRMCLHDGNKVLSNIHTVKAKQDENSSKIWTFKLKITFKISCLEDGEVFIRTDIGYPTLGILFELCISFEKAFCDEYEMSCGWAFMRLLSDSGAPVKSKTRILKVQQTELFSSQLSHISSPGKSSLLQKIREQQKMPRIVVSICSPDKIFTQQMGFLPSTLIGPMSCIPLISLYRKVMCEDLLQKSSFDSTDWIQSPLLSNMNRIFNELDLTNLVRKLWNDEMKSYKSSNIRGEKSKKKAFRGFFMNTILPAINSNLLSPYKLGHWINEKAREKELAQIIAAKQKCSNDALALSTDLEFRPLSIHMLCTRIT